MIDRLKERLSERNVIFFRDDVIEILDEHF
jgi:hypothetical protein